jgi:hypothetical protein
MWHLMTMVVSICLLSSACSLMSGNAHGIRNETRESDFQLAIFSPREVWAAGAPIEVTAELSYVGPGARQVWGPGPGDHFAFDLEELTGVRKLQGSFLLACLSFSLTRSPIAAAFRKGADASQEDPDAAFDSTFLDDPQLRLPVGRWKITASAPFSLGPDPCGGARVDLLASITLTVE